MPPHNDKKIPMQKQMKAGREGWGWGGMPLASFAGLKRRHPRPALSAVFGAAPSVWYSTHEHPLYRGAKAAVLAGLTLRNRDQVAIPDRLPCQKGISTCFELWMRPF